MPIKGINNISDAIARLSEQHDGDCVMVRTMTLNVPTASYDMAVVNASMKLMSDKTAEELKFTPTEMVEGKYEVVAIFHLRRTDHSDFLIH